MTLVTQLDEALPLTALTLPASATTYRASLGGVVRTLTLSPEGVVDARQNGCVVSGQLGPAAITGALLVRLHLGGCGGDGDYSGVAYADPDAPNAAFRVVVDNGSSILDFFAFP